MAVGIYKIHVFDEAFFLLTTKMLMVTKVFRVVTYYEELSPINTHDISTEWPCWVMWQNTYLYLQKMYRHHNRQGADVVVETSKHDRLFKRPTWGHVTIWKIYTSIFMRFIANELGRLLTLGSIFSTQTLKLSPTSCFRSI